MASKSFPRNFGDFKGLDLYASPLSPETNFATVFENAELINQYTITKRKGFKLAAQPFGVDMAYLTPRVLGVYSGRFGNPPTEVRELIGLGETNRIFTLGAGTFKVIGPANATFSFLPGATGWWWADCLINGVSVGGSFPFNCGSYNTVSLSELKTEIDALGGGWSCTLTPYAKVNGAHAVVDHANPVAVDAGHTLSIASYFPKSPRVEVMYSTGLRYFVDIVDIVGNNIRFKPSAAFALADNALIGVGYMPACLLPITEEIACTGAGLTLSFTFWAENYTPTLTAVGFPSEHAQVFKNLKSVTYFPALVTTYGVSSGMWKYDGRETYNAGLPECPLISTSLVAAAGAGLGVGRYKYVAEYLRIDAPGNEIHGNASDVVGDAVVTTTAGNQNVTVTLNGLSALAQSVFGRHGAVISAAAGPVNTLTVTAATNTLRLGDWIWFQDSVGALHYRQVTVLTDTAVTISGAAVTVSNVAPLNVLSNILVRLHRSKAGSNFLYYQGDYPERTGAWNITDAVADAALGEWWGGPYVGVDRRDLPPCCAIIEEHQGLLCGIASPYEPDTLFWSNYESPEYWSRSSNYQEIAMGEVGKITALASDSLDTLVVFKETAYKTISGDLFSGAFSLTSEPRGDVGCPCSRGWVQSRGLIMFLSHGGPRTIVNGELQPIDTRLAETFGPKNWRDYLKYSFLAIDRNRRKIYVCNYQLGSYVLDLIHNVWSKFNFGFLLPYLIGGGSNLNDKFYLNTLSYGPSSSSFGAGALWEENGSGTIYDYIDPRGGNVRLDVQFQWDSLDDPGVDKAFQKVALLSVGQTALNFEPFSLKVYVAKDYQVSDYAYYVASFAAYNETQKEIPLPLDKARAVQLKLINENRYEPCRVNGYEIQVALPYKKEHIKEVGT